MELHINIKFLKRIDMFKCFKKKFIIKYYFDFVKENLIGFLYYLNIFIPKNNLLIVAFVDYEKVDDKLIPYKSDNVYLLSEYIKKKNSNIKIVYLPSNQFGGKAGKYFTKIDKIKFLFYRLRAKIILFKHPPHISNYYTKQQYLIGLGYFIPFKADYWDFKKWYVFYENIISNNFDEKGCSKYREKILKYFTYTKNQFDKTNLIMITSSNYAADTLARAHNWNREVFKILGIPKSDVIKSEKNISIKDIFNIKNNNMNLKFVLYTPTFRDIYIRKSINEISEDKLNIFGYQNEKKELEQFLVENNIVIIIKLHKSFPFYRELEQKFINEDKTYFKNCYFLDFETEAKFEISVYDLFQKSDAMIADYSSISFDYLIYDKPIIYNIPDIEEYREYRGFSYEPIEELMAGDKVKNIEEFKSSLLKIVNNDDEYQMERKKVLNKINEIPKGKALDNIYNYIKGLIKE